MSETILATQIHALELDIINYQRNPANFLPLSQIQSYLDSNDPGYYPRPFYRLFAMAEDIHDLGCDPDMARVPPQFAFTETILNIGKMTMLPMGDHGDHGCLGAELFHARSLYWHESDQPIRQDHVPAVILFDKDDRPFGYQKSIGTPNTAITWRKAIFNTEAGVRTMPANALIRLLYGSGTDENMSGPAYDYQGAGLIAIRGGSGPLDVEFLRHSTSCLPPMIRDGATDAGVLENPEVAQHRDQAIALNPANLRDTVHKLLRKGSAITVSG